MPLNVEIARVNVYKAALAVQLGKARPVEERRNLVSQYLEALAEHTVATFEAFYNPDGTNKGGE